MEYKSLFSYYKLGTSCRYLQDASAGWVIGGTGGIKINVEHFVNELDKLGLPVTKRVADDQLKDFLEKLGEYADDEETELNAEDGKDLSKAIQTIRTTLDAEIQGVGAFTPTPKKRFGGFYSV